MKVLVVGGGSAGWITACYLDASLNGIAASADTPKAVEVSLIESARIGRIGVGEATVPTILRTLHTMGISEKDFMRAADATFKHAIRFRDWAHEGHDYFHPFERRDMTARDRKGLAWLSSDRATPFASAVSPQPWIADKGLAPKNATHGDYRGAVTYAYHMDAEKFADFLRDTSVARGVRHIVDDVVDVETAADTTVTAVKTASGERLEADLFIDCTGFARVLSEKAVGGTFEDYGQYLLCDRAVTLRVPYDVHRPVSNIRPYTTATARGHGWTWDIGLHHRRGTGYVYSSAYLGDDEAEADLRRFEGPHTDGIDARRIAFRSGRMREPWRGNVIAIGLSAGFLEPLESTGLFFIEEGVDYLCEVFPRFTAPDSPELAKAATLYNTRMRQRYEESLDFIALHYCLSRRTDTPFWQEVVKPERIPPRLAERLALWEVKPPSRLDFTDATQLFAHVNYEYILYGMGWTPKGLKDAGTRLPRDEIRDAEIRAKQMLPPHESFIHGWLG